jgi:type I restriction enzyme S subunit
MSVNDPNANRPGYKETKVGWIPEEWGCMHLDQAFTESKEKGKEGLVTYSVTVDRGLVPRSKLDRKMAPDLPPNQSLYLDKGCIAYNMMRMWQGSVAVAEAPCVVSPAYVVCKPTSEVSPDFYLRYFKSHRGLYELWAYSYGITNDRLRLYFDDFSKVPAPLPSLPEQKKIAEILSTCDEAIEKTAALIDAKKRQKRALTQQLLTGRKRLPGFEGDGTRKEYRFFDLPSDWSCPHVREIAQERSQRNGDSDDHTVLTCSKHRGFVESASYFKKQVYSEDTSNYKVVRRGWFGFPSNHVEEGSIGLLSTHDSGIVSPIYCVFETSSQIHPDYLYAVFKSETFRHIFSVTTNASVDRRGSLRWDAFASIRVPCPSLQEQIAIAAVNQAAADEIAVLNQKLTALKQQKKALMQKLLTGQIRVKV